MNPNPVWMALEIHGMIPKGSTDDFETLVRDVHKLAREQQTTDFGVPSLNEIRTRLLAGESVAQIAGVPQPQPKPSKQ